MLTIVMYHYVRPLRLSAFPRLKALELDAFVQQISYLSKNYNLVSPGEVRAALTDNSSLPPNACLLSFDDGYSDHYKNVMPVLDEYGATGIFFAPAMSLVDRQVLKVNKIQFILANSKNPVTLAGEIDAQLELIPEIDLPTLAREHFVPNRFDCAEINYFKRLLQYALPQDVRDKLIDRLFQQHITEDELAFADDLYLTVAQAREMEAQGMEFGAHGDKHLWHNRCSDRELAGEIAGSIRVLNAVGRPTSQALYCYPFGGFDDRVTSAVESAGFVGAFSVEPRPVDLGVDSSMCLPRLDTNDLPKQADAFPDRFLVSAKGSASG